MTDDINADNQDGQQVNNLIEEAFAVSTDAAVAEAEEGSAVQSLTQSFETYVQQYQDTWQQTWQASIEAFEQEVQKWQDTVAAEKIAQNQMAKPKAAAKPKAGKAEN